MKGKENIEELFREGLKDFQSSVDPSVWQGVQSGLSAASGATGAGGVAAASGKMSVLAKAAITLAGAAAVSTGVYYYTADETSEKEASKSHSIEKEISVESNEQSIETEDESIAFVPENTETVQEEPRSVADQDISKEDDFNTPTTDEIERTETTNSREQSTSNASSYETNNGASTGENSASTAGGTNAGVGSGSNGAASGGSPGGSMVQEGQKEEEEKEEAPQRIALSISLVTQKNQFVELSATTNFDGDVKWDMGDGYMVEGKHVEYYYDEPGEYVVKAYAGKVEEEILLKVYHEGKITNLPNVMTPNGDGVNDYLFIESEGLTTFSIVVFNKKQQVVFSSKDVDFKWDGIHERAQTPCPEGEYYYIITATDKGGNTINKHQILTIER